MQSPAAGKGGRRETQGANIIVVHDIASEAGADFIVMEYITGKTLDQLIPRKGMRLGDALKGTIVGTPAYMSPEQAEGIPLDARCDMLEFFQFSSGTNQLLLKIEGRAYQGLSVSSDRKVILFSKSITFGAGLMMIENFR